jgi:hypothetical protein
MKANSEFDRAALDRFSSEGGPPRQDPALPECVEAPGTMSGFHPRAMPMLRVACPTADGTGQRYRKPLWRSFDAVAVDIGKKGPAP